MTYEEIIGMSEANKGSFGMSPEEIERRQALIRNVAQHSPDIAMDMAKGPYRINGGSGAPPQGAPYQGAGPQMQQTQSAPRQPSVMSAQPMGQQWRPQTGQPSGGSAAVMSSPTVPPPGSQSYYSPGYQQPSTNVGNPRYEPPQSSAGPQAQTPTININVNGTQPSAYPGYPSMQSAPPAAAGPGSQSIIPPYQTPLGASSPNYVPPTNTFGPPMQMQMPSFGGPPPIPEWQRQFPMGKTDYAPSAMTSPNYPYSPNWVGQNLSMPPSPRQPQLSAADFGPARPMFDLGVGRPAPMAQITPLNGSGPRLSR